MSTNKLLFAILLTILFQSCELERVNPYDIEASEDIKSSHVLFYKYEINSETNKNKIIDRNETVYLDILLKNFGAKSASNVMVKIVPKNINGNWDIRQNIYSVVGSILPKNYDAIYIENPGLKFGLKLTAPNIASKEILLLTITDNSGKQTTCEMIVNID